MAPPSTLLTVDDADQRPVRCQYAQYDQSRKRNAAGKKGLEINCPFIFLPLFEYADVRKTWHNETESFHSGKMSTSFTSRVHQVRKWAIELSLLNELLSDLVGLKMPTPIGAPRTTCISPKAKQIPDLDFKSVFYLRRIHLGNLYRHSTSWYFSGVAYNQWIVHWISEYYSKKITKVSEVAIHTLYCSDKTTLPLRVFAALPWGPDHPAGKTRTSLCPGPPLG